MVLNFRLLPFCAQREHIHSLAHELMDSKQTIKQARFLNAFIPKHSSDVNDCFIEATACLKKGKFSHALQYAQEGKELLENSICPNFMLNTYFLFIKAVCSMHCLKTYDAHISFSILHSLKLPQEVFPWIEMQNARIFLDDDEKVFDCEAAYANAKQLLHFNGQHPFRCELLLIQTIALNQLEKFKEAQAALKLAADLNPNHPVISSIPQRLPAECVYKF